MASYSQLRTTSSSLRIRDFLKAPYGWQLKACVDSEAAATYSALGEPSRLSMSWLCWRQEGAEPHPKTARSW